MATGFVLWRVVVLAGYRAQGVALVREAARLPREYTVGEGQPLRMVVLGDSTAAGVGASSLEATLPFRVARGLARRVEVTNLSVPGARLLDVVREQLSKVTKGAELVLVSVSANDATRGTSPSDLEDGVKTLLEGLQNLEVKRAVISTTPNFRTTPALPWAVNRLFERRASKFSDTIRDMAKRYSDVRIADLNLYGSLTVGQYAADGFHPNEEGYAEWAALFLRAWKEGGPAGLQERSFTSGPQ